MIFCFPARRINEKIEIILVLKGFNDINTAHYFFMIIFQRTGFAFGDLT